MSEDKRNFLRSNTKIELRHKTSGGTECFVISSIQGEPGGACVCYKAKRNGVNGLLKEFYPRDFTTGKQSEYNSLVRNEKKQLVAVGDAYIKRFEQLKEEFIAGYSFLNDMHDPKGRSGLTNYFPQYELFEGTEGENSTVYVWTGRGSGLEFSKYIESVWKNPRKDSAFNLHNILCAVRTIASCVCEMHKKGLLHRDITPGNFMVLKDAAGKINPHNVLMFDINSFARTTAQKYAVGTSGFMAPEVLKGGAEYRSDIYSLGALLFCAVAGKNRKYSDCDYENIDEIINQSVLFEEVDIYLIERVKSILRNSLAVRTVKRYRETEDFIKELDKAITRLLGYTESKKLDSHQRLQIIDSVKPVKARPIFQNLLYKKPIYDYFSEDTRDVNVLVLGGGVYAQLFTDAVLQVLQIENKRIYITVVSEAPDYDRSIYLRERPDMERFFEITKEDDERNASPIDSECYGRVTFVQRRFTNNKAENTDIIKGLLEKYNPCYTMVSLGSDELNSEIAAQLAAADNSIAVNFVWGGEKRRFRRGNPVYVNQETKYKDIDERLIRMAFNTHLVWNDSLNKDIDELDRDFKKSYNYNSSISFALSVPYKLKSWGKTFEEVEKNTASVRRMGEDEIREAAYYEHRRWVTEKVCEGFYAPVNEEGKVDVSVCTQWEKLANKNENEKIHLCIAKGTSKKTPAKRTWDTYDVKRLDDIDRVSVELYRKFKELTRSLIDEYPRTGSTMLNDICSMIPHDNSTLITICNEYAEAVNAIVYESNALYANGFASLHKRFKKAVEAEKLDNGETILSELKRIEKIIAPAVLFCKKADYKAMDEDLVRSLAYIIGHKPRPKMAMVFEDGRFGGVSNDRLFRNVVAATMIIPKTLLYMYHYTNQTDTKQFIKAARGVLSYFDSKKMKTSVELLIVSPVALPDDFIKELEDIETNRKFSVSQIVCDGDINKILRYECRDCDLIDITNLPYATVVENNRFINIMSDLPYFEIDPATGDFLNVSGCEYLYSIDKKGVRMMIKDIFALRDVKSRSETSDMRGIYKALWEIYTGSYIVTGKKWQYGVNNWTELTHALSEYEKTNGILARYEKKVAYSPTATEKFSRILPMECYDTVVYLLKELKEHGFIKDSVLKILSADSISVEITHYGKDDNNQTQKLFSEYERLQKKLTTQVYYRGNNKVMDVRYNSLEVKDVKISANALKCMTEIAKKGYIIRNGKEEEVEEERNGKKETLYKVSFTYAFAKIKDVLTVAGSILELHTYYSILDNPEFDDVGLSVVAQTGQFENEFDLIITKGLRSVFVECKARKQLEQGFYHKLSSLAGLYGINCTPIIVSNEYSNYLEGIRIVNSEQKARGDELGIITISEISEIDNISNVIMGIINPDKE